jgi:hypothetical protein
MEVHVFFSWQSDTPPDRGSELIGRALAHAANSLSADTSTPYRPAVDQDTRGVPGSPSMVAAILRKIDDCSLFVADVSLTYEKAERERKSPNPNVLLELGYALRRLGTERLLLVLDTATGRPEQLPFDLRGNRVITYDSRGDATALENALAATLRDEIALVFRTVGPPGDVAPPVFLDIAFTKERIESERHDYQLHVHVTNRGDSVVTNWAVELRFPTDVLNPQRRYPIVACLSGDRRTTMRVTEANHSGPIFPGEKRELLAVDYLMTHELYERRSKLFPQQAEALFYAGNRLLASARREFADLQWF